MEYYKVHVLTFMEVSEFKVIKGSLEFIIVNVHAKPQPHFVLSTFHLQSYRIELISFLRSLFITEIQKVFPIVLQKCSLRAENHGRVVSTFYVFGIGGEFSVAKENKTLEVSGEFARSVEL